MTFRGLLNSSRRSPGLIRVDILARHPSRQSMKPRGLSGFNMDFPKGPEYPLTIEVTRVSIRGKTKFMAMIWRVSGLCAIAVGSYVPFG